MVIRCFGFGEPWYGDVSRGSYATAASMEVPAGWNLRYWQNCFREPIIRLIDFAVARSISAGDLTLGNESASVDVDFPRIEPRDDGSLPNLLLALSGCVQSGLLDWREASSQAYQTLGSSSISDLLEKQFGDQRVPLLPSPQQQAADDANAAAAAAVAATPEPTDTDQKPPASQPAAAN
jgi:hypothetical protein